MGYLQLAIANAIIKFEYIRRTALWSFAEVIKNIRSRLSLSQEGLARELHMGFTSVNKWENNKSKPNQIARRFGRTLQKK